MEKRIVIAILTIAAFILSQKAAEFLKLFSWYVEMDAQARGVFYKITWYVAFPLFILGLFHGFRNVREAAGLSFSRFKYGLNAGFIGTLPMLLGTGFLANFNLTINPSAILIGCLLAAVGEETLYRGLLFVQLFRYAQWGFVFAGLASALFFGAGHLYQGDSWHYRFNPHSNGYRSGRV